MRDPARRGHADGVLDDPLATLPDEVLRERLPELVRESCAWAVGLSDRPHVVRRGSRVVTSGVTLGARAATGQPMSADDDGRLELSDARPGTFRDALNALTAEGDVWADRYDAEVVAPFVERTCVAAAERARATEPVAWEELLDELGEDGDDLLAVARGADWDSALRGTAEDLALAALGDVPLVEVEDEGLPLAVVRAAEAEARDAAPVLADDPPAPDPSLAGTLFLADRALADAALPVPVPAEAADALLSALTEYGVEPEEVLRVVEHLPVTQEAVERIALLLDAG